MYRFRMFECIVLGQMHMYNRYTYIYIYTETSTQAWTSPWPPVLQACRNFELQRSRQAKSLPVEGLEGFSDSQPLPISWGEILPLTSLGAANGLLSCAEIIIPRCIKLRSHWMLDLNYSNLSIFFNCREAIFTAYARQWLLMGRCTNSRTSPQVLLNWSTQCDVQHDPRGICKAMPSCHRWCRCHSLWGWGWTAYKQSISREVELMRSFGNAAKHDEE